jgi:hypothetical protein
MGLIELEGEQKESYLESLVDALDLLGEQVPHSDVARVAEILRIASFGKDLPSLGMMEIDDASGLPCKGVLDILQAHKRFIEEEHQETLPLQGELIAAIKDRIYNNDFEFASDLVRLKECVFTDRLKHMAFTADRELIVTRGDMLDVGLRHHVLVRGYDLTKAGWLRYDIDIYKLHDKFLRPNIYFKERGDAVSAKPAFENMAGGMFGFNARYWFDAINKTPDLRVGKISVQHVAGFHTSLVCGDELKQVFAGHDDEQYALDFRHVEREDTDITMSDEFTPDYLIPGYQPELIVDQRRILVVSPGIADAAKRYAQSQSTNCVVYS